MNITVNLQSSAHHCSQVLTGLIMLAEHRGYSLNIQNHINDPAYKHYAAVEVIADGKKLMYDMMDGYLATDKMRYCIENSDFYFKRSYSEDKNNELFADISDKIYPLGMNYDVAYRGNPYSVTTLKEVAKHVLGRKPYAYFNPNRFETRIAIPKDEVDICFFVRLWDPNGNLDTNVDKLNANRIQIVQMLRNRYGNNFKGGLADTELAQRLAPELIVPKHITKRENYLSIMKSCDICIGTIGLHKSTGWKTAEYVAAAKAIVQEKLFYSDGGHFQAEKNYLEFTDAESCIAAVERLVNNPDLLYEIKLNNLLYYHKYLRPDMLIYNTFKTASIL